MTEFGFLKFSRFDLIINDLSEKVQISDDIIKRLVDDRKFLISGPSKENKVSEWVMILI